MSKVDIYNCSLPEERREPHGSTVFLVFITASAIVLKKLESKLI